MIDEVIHNLRYHVLPPRFAELLDAHLDPALPLPAGMVEELEVLVLHNEVASELTTRTLARYLDTWQQTHSRQEATRQAWLTRHHPEDFIARDHAPADLPATLHDPNHPEPIDVFVGAELDPVQILLAGRRTVSSGQHRRSRDSPHPTPRTRTHPKSLH